MVAVFGTMCADVLHVRFNVPYAVSTTGFAVALAAVFITWHLVEHTLSIHSIFTLRRELFYWAAVLATFAMGTALGDLTADVFHLGFFSCGPALYRSCSPSRGWPTGLPGSTRCSLLDGYVLTRPLGASYADWLGVPTSLGGLDWGRGTVAIIFTIPIVILVGYLTVSRVDVPADQREVGGAGSLATEPLS